MTKIDTIARLCHEANRIFCESHGDNSQPKWEDAPDWQVQSARSGVIHLMINKGVVPSDSHVNWLKDKESEGWIYGKEKDPAKKTHPCMVPYEQLDPIQQHKDHLFHAIVRGLQ